MNTTFGVKVKSIYTFYGEEEDEIVEVAFRGSYMRWKEPLAQLLPDDLLVIALDNSPQGIYTIKDIKEEIKNQRKNLL